MAKSIPTLFLFFSPLLCIAQMQCLDLTTNCSGSVPIETTLTLPYQCGDTIVLSPTTEICNNWEIASGINHYFGTNSDSSTAFIIANACLDPIQVIGTTNTISGADTAVCMTTINYLFESQNDTIQEFIECQAFLELEEQSIIMEDACSCDTLVVEYVTDFSPCISCGDQCIYITGTTTISGGDTEGADVIVTYALNGDTLTVGSADWLGDVEQLECFSATDDVEIISAEAFVPQGATGNASAEAWLVLSPDMNETTYLFEETCLPTATGIFYDTLLASTGCDSFIIRQVDLYPETTVIIESDHACIGDPVTLIADAAGGVSYLWNDGTVGEVLVVNNPGNYTVTVTDNNGCEFSASGAASFSDIEIELTTRIAEQYLLTENPIEVWEGSAVELRGDVFGTPFPYEFIWNGGPELGDTTYNYIAQESNEITIAIIDSVGCIGTASIQVNVRPPEIFVPSAFSPNSDQINDVLEVFTSPNVEEARLQIFTRTGNLVFDQYLSPQANTNSLTWTAWDGVFRGDLLMPQVLVYQLRYRLLRGEWKFVAGDVSLIR